MSPQAATLTFSTFTSWVVSEDNEFAAGDEAESVEELEPAEKGIVISEDIPPYST